MKTENEIISVEFRIEFEATRQYGREIRNVTVGMVEISARPKWLDMSTFGNSLTSLFEDCRVAAVEAIIESWKISDDTTLDMIDVTCVCYVRSSANHDTGMAIISEKFTYDKRFGQGFLKYINPQSIFEMLFSEAMKEAKFFFGEDELFEQHSKEQ